MPAQDETGVDNLAVHGWSCVKVEHTRDGYLHAANDDTPFDDDGLVYCGRCHVWMGARAIREGK